ncbi:iron-containing alcohol dehydrogenase, partial [Paracoccus sp. PXZ]
LNLPPPQPAGLADACAPLGGDRAVGRFTGAVMHTPVEVSEQATEQARSIGADVLVAVGGGSTTGLGKAIALRTGLPQIVVPTTYAG